VALLLSACAATPTPPPAPIAVIAPPPPQNPIGLERVLGQPPSAVVKLIGSPDLDRQEGKGRQLQFANGACVLDVFFYPPPAGGEVLATYADARLKDGKPLDAASCLALQVKAEAPPAPTVQPQPPPAPGRKKARTARG
jgi:hypothetical protein